MKTYRWMMALLMMAASLVALWSMASADGGEGMERAGDSSLTPAPTSISRCTPSDLHIGWLAWMRMARAWQVSLMIKNDGCGTPSGFWVTVLDADTTAPVTAPVWVDAMTRDSVKLLPSFDTTAKRIMILVDPINQVHESSEMDNVTISNAGEIWTTPTP